MSDSFSENLICRCNVDGKLPIGSLGQYCRPSTGFGTNVMLEQTVAGQRAATTKASRAHARPAVRLAEPFSYKVIQHHPTLLVACAVLCVSGHVGRGRFSWVATPQRLTARLLRKDERRGRLSAGADDAQMMCSVRMLIVRAFIAHRSGSRYKDEDAKQARQGRQGQQGCGSWWRRPHLHHLHTL